MMEKVFYKTKSVCPVCNRLISAEVFSNDNKVYMSKECKEHGKFKVLVYSDLDMYLRLNKFVKEGTKPLQIDSKVDKGCPYDCGLCEDHQQHTCDAMIDITSACQIECPICYNDSKGNDFLSVEEFGCMLDRLIKNEGCGCNTSIQLLGGEPTLHPKLIELIEVAEDKGIKLIIINTNGIKIAQDLNLVKRLSEHKILIELQFDGFEDHIDEELRGEKLLETKLKALKNLSKYNLQCTLVQTVKKGLNNNQFGKLINYSIGHDINGLVITPLAYIGRADKEGVDPLDRYTPPDIIKDIEKQTNGMFTKEDFFPLSCPHITCIMWAYGFKVKNKVLPISKVINIEDYTNFIKNKMIDDTQNHLTKMIRLFLSAAKELGLRKVFGDFFRVIFAMGLKGLFTIKKIGFKIIIHDIMDVYSFDTVRLKKCCIHSIIPNKGVIPFCSNNIIHRVGAHHNENK